VFRFDRVRHGIFVRRRADLFKLRNCILITCSSSLLKNHGVAKLFLTHPVHALPGSNICGKKFGPLPNSFEADDRTSRNAEHRNSLSAKMFPCDLGNSNRVGGDAVQRQWACSRFAVLGLRRAGARLVPLDEREVSLPWRKKRGHAAECRPRAAKDEQGRIAAIAAAKRQPLRDAVEFDKCAFVDRLSSDLRGFFCVFHSSFPSRTQSCVRQALSR